MLEDLTEPATLGKELLIAFDDSEDYYRYVSGFYPEEGTFAMSSGMHLGSGCGHFVTHGTELHAIEPVIVHAMTHSCLAHLSLPVWLDEGMAVNAERMFAQGLQVDLGEFVRLFLRRGDGTWGPRPSCWPTTPEQGGFD